MEHRWAHRAEPPGSLGRNRSQKCRALARAAEGVAGPICWPSHFLGAANTSGAPGCDRGMPTGLRVPCSVA